jgi:hypothetical protein
MGSEPDMFLNLTTDNRSVVLDFLRNSVHNLQNSDKSAAADQGKEAEEILREADF